MKIAMDLDGVIFDWPKAFTEYTNTKYDYYDNHEEFSRWDYFNDDNISLSKEEFEESYAEFNKYRMWQGLELYPNSKQALCAIHAMGHEIIYMTSRPRDSEMSTLKSIIGHGLPINGILFTENKAEIAKNLGVVIGVDDKPKTLLEYEDIGIIPVKFLHSYNEDTELGFGIDITNLETLVVFIRKNY